MAEVVIQMTSGVLCDHLSRTMRPVTYMAFPDDQQPPLGIWGPTDPRPTPPIYMPPVVPVPPDLPNVPPPGSPPVIVPGAHPINPIVPPDAVTIEYPGVGKVIVPKPLPTVPA